MSESQSKLYGCQTPTFRWCAEYKESLGDVCFEFLKAYGVELFEWERNQINDWLALDANNAFINMIVGLCVPRRNGKTLVVAAVSTFFLTIYPEYIGVNRFKILYSSHSVSTNMETFDTFLDEFFDNEEKAPDLYKLTHWGVRNTGIGKSNGKEQIVCKWKSNGIDYKTTIKFNARSKNKARGVGCNVIIFDEAQELTAAQTAAMLPTAGSSKVKPQVIYLGTPDYPDCDGTTFKELRQRAIDKKPRGVCWSEWSVNEIGDVSDRKRWAATNPSLGYILNEDWIEISELNSMSEDDFARERLGYWAKKEELLDLPISEEDWEICATNEPLQGKIVCYGIKFDYLSEHAAVSVCVKNDECFHIELADVVDCKNGISELIEKLTTIGKKAAQIIIDGKGTSYDVQQRLLKNRVPKSAIIVTKPTELGTACMMLANAVAAHEITHFAPQEQLNDAATTCTRRIIGKDGTWGFDNSDKGYAFIIESAALAYYSCRITKRNPNRKGRIG